jgi:hypothetical protein
MQAFFLLLDVRNTLSQGFESERSVSCHNARSGFSETTLQQIQQAAKHKGFASIAAMIRHAVDQELASGDGVD